MAKYKTIEQILPNTHTGRLFHTILWNTNKTLNISCYINWDANLNVAFRVSNNYLWILFITRLVAMCFPALVNSLCYELFLEDVSIQLAFVICLVVDACSFLLVRVAERFALTRLHWYPIPQIASESAWHAYERAKQQNKIRIWIMSIIAIQIGVNVAELTTIIVDAIFP